MTDQDVLEAGAPRSAIQFHPVQYGGHVLLKELPEYVVLRAYEVYCHLYGKQDAMVNVAAGCRGGFSAGEIVAFLYARSFPREEWRQRVDEAFVSSGSRR